MVKKGGGVQLEVYTFIVAQEKNATLKYSHLKISKTRFTNHIYIHVMSALYIYIDLTVGPITVYKYEFHKSVRQQKIIK